MVTVPRMPHHPISSALRRSSATASLGPGFRFAADGSATG